MTNLKSDWDVEKVKSARLHPDQKSYRPTTWYCERCPFTTPQVTAAYVHAWVIHQDKRS